jgi:hypothetical protein
MLLLGTIRLLSTWFLFVWVSVVTALRVLSIPGVGVSIVMLGLFRVNWSLVFMLLLWRVLLLHFNVLLFGNVDVGLSGLGGFDFGNVQYPFGRLFHNILLFVFRNNFWLLRKLFLLSGNFSNLDNLRVWFVFDLLLFLNRF